MAGSMVLGAREYGNEDGLEGVFRYMMVREVVGRSDSDSVEDNKEKKSWVREERKDINSEDGMKALER